MRFVPLLLLVASLGIIGALGLLIFAAFSCPTP